MAEAILKQACPCLFGDEEARKKMMEMAPFKSSTHGSDSDSDKAPEGMADRAKGFLSMAMAPVKAFQQKREQDAARDERKEKLKAGSVMKLLTKDEPRGVGVRLSLSSDGALLTWQSLAMVNNMPKESGVLALSSVEEIKPVLQSGFLRSGAPIPGQWQLIAGAETVKFEADCEEDKEQWMTTLEELRHHEADAKAERKIGHQTRRKMEIEKKQRDAERRKAEVLKSCGNGGMKHTAAAMMNRS